MTDAPRARAFRTWSLIHTWTSLISMIFLLMLCLTGLPLIFHHELDHLLGYEPPLPEMPAGTPHVPLDRIVATAAATRPAQVVQFVVFDKDEPDAVLIGLGKTLQTVPADSFVGLDLRTAEVLMETAPGAGPIGFLLKLHTDLFLDLPGKLFLGVMALLFVVAIVSGVVLYGPFMRKLDFGTVRRGRAARIKWLDWHNLLGAATIVWALVVGTTGAVNTWADLMLKLWQMGQLAEMTAPYRDAPRPETLVSLDRAVATAQEAAPDMRTQFIAFPGTPFSSNNHYGIHGRQHAADGAAAQAGPDRRADRRPHRHARHALVRAGPVPVAAAAFRGLRRAPAQARLGPVRPGDDHRAGQRPLSLGRASAVAGVPGRCSSEPGEGIRGSGPMTDRTHRIWTAPGIIAAATAVSLISALLAEGIWDAVAAGLLFAALAYAAGLGLRSTKG
jgi:uncharacterized iron-regulated membrane protein